MSETGAEDAAAGAEFAGTGPGAILPNTNAPPIELNAGRKLISLAVTNAGDRPIQVGPLSIRRDQLPATV